MTPDEASGTHEIAVIDTHDFYVVIGFDVDGTTLKPIELTYTAELICALEFFRTDIGELDLVVVLGMERNPAGTLTTIVSSGPFDAVLGSEDLQRISADFVAANRPWSK